VTLPAIAHLRQDGHQAAISFVLSPDLDVFRGHFPNMPILPGVAQLDWVMQLTVRCFGIAEPVARDFQVKFSDVIRPGVLLVLLLRLDQAGQRLFFEYKVDERIMSSGRIKLESLS
jgi:3-hydroxymyristoyl/3-hydroxydecanoyl-(acyl carrier protein) dehydratase